VFTVSTDLDTGLAAGTYYCAVVVKDQSGGFSAAAPVVVTVA
jgi:hypothetical protein